MANNDNDKRERQLTFGSVVGMSADVPTERHDDDLVECSDGTVRCHADVHYDCRGGAHGSDEDRMESNVEIVTEVLMKVDEWVVEYTTENSDYPDGYAYICDEDAVNWRDRFVEYVRERLEYEFDLDDLDTGDDRDEWLDSVADAVYERCDAGMDVEAEYDRNEYACYSGSGFAPYSLDIGEYENQLDIAEFDELQALHDAGELDDVLDHVNCDVYVNRSKRREKNEATGRYEDVGRETYMPYKHSEEHPNLMTYHSPGGQWHYVLSAESVDQMIEDELERRADK